MSSRELVQMFLLEWMSHYNKSLWSPQQKNKLFLLLLPALPSQISRHAWGLTPGLRNRFMCLCSKAWFCWLPAQKFCRNSWASLIISCILVSSACVEGGRWIIGWKQGYAVDKRSAGDSTYLSARRPSSMTRWRPVCVKIRGCCTDDTAKKPVTNSTVLRSLPLATSRHKKNLFGKSRIQSGSHF